MKSSEAVRFNMKLHLEREKQLEVWYKKEKEKLANDLQTIKNSCPHDNLNKNDKFTICNDCFSIIV